MALIGCEHLGQAHMVHYERPREFTGPPDTGPAAAPAALLVLHHGLQTDQTERELIFIYLFVYFIFNFNLNMILFIFL